MLPQPGEKHIVNTASIAGLIPTPGVGVYATSKYAVVGLSEHLRMDLARHAIGVSVLCPGGVQTQILSSQRNRPEELGAPPAPAEDMRRLTSGSERHPDEMQRRRRSPSRPQASARTMRTSSRTRTTGKIEARCAALITPSIERRQG
jgi:short-subunit dehydrogenase